MLKNLLFDNTRIPLLIKGLDAFALRHRAIASNVVNSETVGYQRRQVQFEEQLKLAIGNDGLTRKDLELIGSGGSISDKIKPKIVVDSKISDINDLNNVDIDREMADMAENHLQFNIASRLAKHNFEMLMLSLRGTS